MQLVAKVYANGRHGTVFRAGSVSCSSYNPMAQAVCMPQVCVHMYMQVDDGRCQHAVAGMPPCHSICCPKRLPRMGDFKGSDTNMEQNHSTTWFGLQPSMDCST
jgi:hypothetical protein